MEFQNPIWLAGPIDNKEFFTSFTRRFSEVMAQTKPGDNVTLYINSPGGESYTSLGIYDLINKCDRNITGVVTGIAHSGASLILQGCKRRVMTRHSNLMLHRSAVQISGSVENAQTHLDTLRGVDEKFYEIYSQKSGEKTPKIADMALRDKYFSPKEALDAGLIDGIL